VRPAAAGPARLQVEEVARQCASWAAPEDCFYPGLVERLTGVPDSLRGELDAAACAATAATAGLGAFLRRSPGGGHDRSDMDAPDCRRLPAYLPGVRRRRGLT